MKSVAAAACAAVALAAQPAPVSAQVGNPVNPTVGRPMTSPVGPPAPVRPATVEPRTGPLPSSLTLAQSLDEAAARSPAIVAAEAEVAAAEARIRQAGYRENPELSLEVENVGGTGELKGLRSTETTLAVNQRLDLGGRRSARVGSARAELEVQKLRLAIARADLSQSVREQFARAIAAREKLAPAKPSSVPVSWLASLASWSTRDAILHFEPSERARRWRRQRPSAKRPSPPSWPRARRWLPCSASASRSVALLARRSTFLHSS